MQKPKLPSAWWHVTQEKLIQQLDSNFEKGLTFSQVEKHRQIFGSNTFAKISQKSFITLFLEGIKEPMMLVLIAIGVLSFVFGKLLEASVMMFVVIMYVTVELINKYRADRIIATLKKLAAPTVRVIRNGVIKKIPTEDLVVGDILIISEGDRIPADARLLSTFGLIVNEASLTGESLPVTKDAQAKISADAPLADRTNAIYSGTIVLSGEGTAIITAIGKNTVFGEIAQHVQKTKKEQTVLQKSMQQLAKVLALFALIISALIPAVGYIRGLGLQEMILTWLSLSFLMVPGQPPIIITMALAVAAYNLAKKHVIARRLRGIEVIGQINAIVSDKTGTITENTMVLETFYTSEGKTETLATDDQKIIASSLPQYSSDPTDEAVANVVGLAKDMTPILVSNFSATQPWRDSIYKKNDRYLHAIAGTPEPLIENSTLSENQKNYLFNVLRKESSLGKRIVAYGYIENNTKDLKELNAITFLALAVLKDPVRAGVKDAIKRLEQAGIHTIIVTGDYKTTAQAIAADIGIAGDVITGKESQAMSDRQLKQTLEQSSIFARMDPSEKMRLVKNLQENNQIIAVVGDGVNDTPALKAAEVGIAMGQIGTDLAKEVSDLMLTDDSYTHIPDAVSIGRQALDNFKKGLTYYLTSKYILLTIFLVPLAVGLPFPFTPLQIIMIELLMDLASSTIFITEAAEPEVMNRPPQRLTNVLTWSLLQHIIYYGTAFAVGLIVIYLYTYFRYNLITAQTATLVSWFIGHVLLALNMKQQKVSLFKQGLFANYFGIFWLCAMIVLSVSITLITVLHPFFKTTGLPFLVWIELILITCLTTCWIDVKKLFKW